MDIIAHALNFASHVHSEVSGEANDKNFKRRALFELLSVLFCLGVLLAS